MRLYADSSKCCGCKACLLACSFSHFQENNIRQAALVIEPHFPDPGNYKVRVCVQCGECANVCPADAIPQNDQGAYYIDPELCIDCGDCIDACPEQVIVRVAGRDAPFECDLCGECVLFCGMSALWIAE